MARARVLAEMLSNLLEGPVTIRCPFEKVPVPAGFRGRVMVADGYCIGCGKCAQVCPSACIVMEKDEREVLAKGRTIRRKRRPAVHLFRCIRCGLCEEHCPQEPKAILLVPVFAGSGTDRKVVIR